ncbi:MAG: hypothetical protein IKY21_05230 [Clostridia bacterium]|nr:hypothetical protein [Clostridia bacterium]
MNNEMKKIEEVFNEMPEKKAGFVASHKKAIIITALSILLVGCILFATVAYIVPAMKYGNALEDIENGNYKDAYITLKTLGNYKDSKEILRDFTLVYLNIELLYYDEYGDLSDTTFRSYYENGKEREFSRYDEEGLLREKRECNENGDTLLHLQNKADGTLLQNDYNEYFSDGKIRYHETHSMSGREIQITKAYYQYDENGKISVETRINEFGESKTVYKYDANGRKIEVKEIDTNGKEQKTVYKYDANGRKIEVKETDTNGKEQKTVYEYDENGNKTLEMKYNQSNELTEKRIWEYDASGNTVFFERSGRSNGEFGVTSRTRSTYDANGKKILSVIYDKDDNVREKTEYAYDDDSRLIYMITYDENGDITIQDEYKYNSDGQDIFYEGYKSGIFTRIVAEYDGKGRETLSETYKRIDGGEEFLKNKITSEYDKYGNTILKTEYNNYKEFGSQYGETTEEYEYVLEYDEDGIVIKRTTYLNGVLHRDATYKDPIVLYEPRERE